MKYLIAGLETLALNMNSRVTMRVSLYWIGWRMYWVTFDLQRHAEKAELKYKG